MDQRGHHGSTASVAVKRVYHALPVLARTGLYRSSTAAHRTVVDSI